MVNFRDVRDVKIINESAELLGLSILFCGLILLN